MTDRRLALVVAVDRYDDPDLHQLASPTADADALAEVLGDPDLGGFEVDVLRNAPSGETGRRVESLLARRDRSDLVLLHFSCHGIKDETGELHLAATDTRPDLLGSTAVDAAWVNRLIQRSRAQRVVLLLDCCYGGAFERGMVRSGGDIDVGDQFGQRHLGEGRGRVVITASTAMEFAFEGAQLAGGSVAPSVFTGALVDGIRSGDADRDQDGQVALDELYDFVYDRVRDVTPNQTPSRWAYGVQGDFYVARNPHLKVQPAALPPELLDLAKHPVAAARVAAVRELTPIAEGEDLKKAAAALIALREMTDDDSRMVGVAATAALAETEVRLATSEVDFGETTVGGPMIGREVEVLGSPLAMASTVESGAAVRARLAGSSLKVQWDPRAAGALDETVTLTGPAGTARLHVTGNAVTSAVPGPKPEPITPPRSPTRPIASPLRPPPVRRSVGGRWRRVVALLTIVLLLPTIAVVGWATNRAGRASAKPGGTAPATTPPTGGSPQVIGPRDFDALLGMIPTWERSTCSLATPDSGSTAQALCEGAIFKLWNSKAEMDQYLVSFVAGTGNCIGAPPAAGLQTDLAAVSRRGKLTCGQYTPEGESKPIWFVEWGLDEVLLTGATVSEPGASSAVYPELYRRALATLRGVPE